MGNGWERDDPGSIGKPYRPAGGGDKNDFFGNIDKTDRSVEIKKDTKLVSFDSDFDRVNGIIRLH